MNGLSCEGVGFWLCMQGMRFTSVLSSLATPSNSLCLRLISL